MLKAIAKSLLKKNGYQILRGQRAYAEERLLAGVLERERISLVLDVGANLGQFPHDLRSLGYKGRVISFEPLSAAHAHLRKLAENDPEWTIADRTAIGAEKGQVEFHVAGNSVSSSILDMLPSHIEAAPQSAYVGTETVPVNRLDDICPVSKTDRVLLKIDVQGYERQVLEGAPSILANCRAVVCEMSLIPLYAGQVLAWEFWGLLVAQGFEPWSLEPIVRDPVTDRILQLDGLFVRHAEGAKI